MPLPERNAQWPPAEWAPQAAQIALDRLWLVGPAAAASTSATNELGWLKSMVARVLKIDARTGTTDDANRQHVPLPRLIAATSASLLFSEPPSLVIPEAHETELDADGKEKPPTPVQLAAQAVEDQLTAWMGDDGGWTAKLLQGAFIASGLGGVLLRPTWGTPSGRVQLDVIHADRFVPRFVHGELDGAIVATTVERSPDGSSLLHLEDHERGRVTHGLYRVRGGQLSERLDLGATKATSSLAADKDGMLDLRPLIGDRLLPDYVPNWLPHVVTLDPNIGSADTAGLYDRLSALDRAATAWDTDVDLGEAIMIVPDQFLTRSGQGQGATFDRKQRILSPVHVGALDDTAAVMQFVQADVRSDAFGAAKTDIGVEIALAAGYNPESIDWQNAGGGEMTATEVLARDARSRDTTMAKRRYWGRALASSAEKCLMIDAEIYQSGLTPMRPVVEWPSVQEQDLREMSSTLNLLNLSGSVSTAEKVRMLHPDWSSTRVDAEVDLILKEQGVGVADPTGFGQ